MREFWRQIRVPFFTVGGTLLAVATIIGVGYGVHWAVRNGKIVSETAASGGLAALVTLWVVALYFIPTLVAYSRRHHNWPAIFIANVFAGPVGFLMLSPGIGLGLWAGILSWSATATPVPVIARKA